VNDVADKAKAAAQQQQAADGQEIDPEYAKKVRYFLFICIILF
jgi:hypothetical protein